MAVAQPDMSVETEYLDVHAVETQVLKFGHLRPRESRLQDPQHLFIIIPGNPGVPGYYTEFMQGLWEESGKTVPVWCVGHAGHVTGPKLPALGWCDIVQQPAHVYTLEGQIMHKVNFIKKYVPPDVRLILIGHSIGCYIILNMLSHVPEYRVVRSFMLFPTIERMATTPNGRFYTPVLNYLRWVFIGFIKVLSYFGPRVHQKLIEYHFSDTDTPECGRQASLHVFNPTCANNFTYMGKIEMQEVSDLQEELLARHIDKMSFYYGATDDWCPKEFFYAMRAKFPKADIQLCQKEYSHAFVLDGHHVMAQTVWQWLQPFL